MFKVIAAKTHMGEIKKWPQLKASKIYRGLSENPFSGKQLSHKS
jgi:hypothetical protein